MILKYTVANKEGKKLSGTVEAPDENTARTELNNLGFSILLLQETKETPKIDSSLIKFIFEAIDKNSKLISGSIPAKNEEDALNKLSTEYSLTVSAIWLENSTSEQIEAAKKKGSERLQTQITKPATTTKEPQESNEQDLEKQKKEALIKSKIEETLKNVYDLLKVYDQELKPDQKTEINKKIDKLLRIKNSTNLDYILSTANELLEFIQSQEKSLRENTQQGKRLAFQLETKKMLEGLNSVTKEKNLTQDIVDRIGNWQTKHVKQTDQASLGARIINSILNPIKDFFHTPEEILNIKQQIKIYNKQLFDFVKLYFKEPTKEYKEKVKNSFKAVWNARKKAKENLKLIIRGLKEKKKSSEIEEHLFLSFTEELNSLSGWLLTFYIAYYFIGLYINSKNFGFTNDINGFQIYDTRLFKYILVSIFLLHAMTALKINFLKNSLLANFVLPPAFVFLTVLTLLNF